MPSQASLIFAAAQQSASPLRRTFATRIGCKGKQRATGRPKVWGYP